MEKGIVMGDSFINYFYRKRKYLDELEEENEFFEDEE